MTLKERIKALADENGISLPSLESELGFGNSTIVKWDKSTPKSDKLEKVAAYFNVTTDFLLGRCDYVHCSECGFFFNPINKQEHDYHIKYHSQWEGAVKDYGFCWGYIKSDEVEIISKRILSDDESSTEQKLSAAENILKAHFSNELRKHNFNYPFDFNKFASIELGHDVIKDLFHDEIFYLLADKYGIENESDCQNVIAFSSFYEDLNDCEYSLVEEARKMNQYGRTKLLETAKEMNCNPLYNNDYLQAVAAHERTDIETTDEMRKHDDDIMDDDF